ncbi:uncharacterized protein LOC134266935 [Saccostrea cucullata]|uniref:uncharacterized protein LOC134266935 n=1 Tax=Saccostrea cuccullata TaxID=36930 RepID=UPI002ED16DA3
MGMKKIPPCSKDEYRFKFASHHRQMVVSPNERRILERDIKQQTLFVADVFEKDLIRWKEEDGVFSESHSFSAMLDKVRKQRYMTFVGVPGSGKSATIHHIALILQKEKYEVVPTIDIKKIEDYSDSRNPQVFVIDDVVGVHGLQKQKLESLIDYEKRISDPPNRNTKVLMSCREAVFNECYKSFFSNENNTIKMHSSENILNDEDKKAILQKHGLARDLLTPTLLGGTLDMFPLLCKLYSTLAAMEGTYTKLCGTEYTIIHDSVFEILVYHYGCQFPDLLLQYISSSYIANNVKVQECKEESEVEYKQDENEEFSAEEQETLSSETIQDSFELCIRLREDQYPMLAERLYRDIENMELYDVFMNNVLKHPRVCQAFIEVLDTKSYTDLKSLFLSEQKDVFKVVSKGERVWKESEKREIWYWERDRQRVLLNEKGDYKEITCSVRVISWVVYYGHTQILQYILKQTELHKETKIELFWNSLNPWLIYEAKKGENNVETNIATDISLSNSNSDTTNQKQENSRLVFEHDRLFVLGCYSGDLETELIEAGADVNQQGEYTPLRAACIGGHMSVVKELIEAGADVNQQGEYNTPLRAACKGGHMSVVKMLIEAGADISQQGEFDTQLTAACWGGHLSVVKELIEAGANINQQGGDDTPLTAACESGHISVVKELIEAGASINQLGEYDTPLTAACESGHISVVKELIEAGANINQQGGDDTPLTAACESGHISVVKELIEAGADINQLGEYDTPLTAAYRGGHMSVVKELIEAGADINPQDGYNTPLTAACEGGHISVVKELIEAGADINPKEAGAYINLQGKYDTPLSAACEGGHKSVVKVLIEAGADINSKGTYHTLLIAACKGGHMSVVKELVEGGADINLKGTHHTPLTAALKELIKAGANIELQDWYDTPLTAACKGGHMNVVNVLIEAGADINQKGKYDTPLSAASKGGHMSVVKKLLEAGADNILQDKSETPTTTAH